MVRLASGVVAVPWLMTIHGNGPQARGRKVVTTIFESAAATATLWISSRSDASVWSAPRTGETALAPMTIAAISRPRTERERRITEPASSRVERRLDPRRRHGQVTRGGVSHRVGNGVRDRRADAGRAGLPGAFDAERIGRRCGLVHEK